ncbi:cell division protein ZipA [Nitrogeniibacter aestuarii]|uniref:cell division protein ZipA C-terminal FtsZ-binding domain-containing protein n=1 Tax=Nitrogeniibacter aestuarii TaxID=2815343 RepID=UPI001D1068EF|nr:cell division protein ZipA C-terminal FtsZ-binding domain-containing protein [Nitrogeniibacter aestuarii]
MAISELQMGLIGAGAIAVVGVLAYNKWQERKAQKHAEKTFRSDHRDVLLEPGTSERPGESAYDDISEAPPTQLPDDIPTEIAPSAVAEEAGRKAPPLPPEVDERVDCVIRLESIEPILAGQLWQTQREHLEGLSKPVAWFALDESVNQWRPISPHSGERYHWFCSAMQLVDRRGPINDADFSRFVDGVGRTADQFMAIPTAAPARAESVERAGQLDQFCASVDVQIGVNLVSGAEPFLGTKLRGLVEAQGLALRADGLFHAEDDNGNSLFVLGNLEPTLFSPESLRDMQTQGLTMIVDVPRVANGAQVFDRMMLVAKQLASALGAHVVDDNRQPFGPEAAALIRQQIKHFQGQMQECGMPAGSPLALRLFTA